MTTVERKSKKNVMTMTKTDAMFPARIVEIIIKKKKRVEQIAIA